MPTSSELHKLHKELWQFLMENPMKSKEDWPKWKELAYRNDIPLAINNQCFACQEAKNRNTDEPCRNCPIAWGLGTCQCPGTLYRDWRVESSPKVRSRLAHLIIDLPWKEE